ncbi:MAG: hypothetical protein KTR30_33020 [Saprospiraceae bacterium]|nr:hypothetical protein [Saprospiraceae bacterium]
MALQKLLKGQWLYCVLGILFNVVSWVVLSKSGKPLTPTAPLSGIFVMAIYGLFLLAAQFKQINLYRVLMLVSILILGYGGIISHFRLLSQSPELYHSFLVGLIAILINSFGLILNSLATLGKFRVSSAH